jgi:SHS2 domain-containing protein
LFLRRLLHTACRLLHTTYLSMHELFEHTADIGLRIQAATLEELFCEAAAGLFSLIVENPDDVRQTEAVEIELPRQGDAFDFLLFDWLNDLLYRFDAQRMLFAKFDVRFTDSSLRATAWGEPLDPARHRLEHEVKAITYHALMVAQETGGWKAEVIVDI